MNLIDRASTFGDEPSFTSANHPPDRCCTIRRVSVANATWRIELVILGFHNVTVIDDDLGRSGSGLVERPGFQRLVAESLYRRGRRHLLHRGIPV